MKYKLYLLLAITAIAATPLLGQTMTFGGRYSNYATDLSAGILGDTETGRESSFGLVADYRNGKFVLSGRFDHDLQGDDNSSILDFSGDEFSRDRFELTVGFAPAPVVDIEAGMRMENMSLGDSGIFDFTSDLEFDHQALVFGINIHTPTIRPIGWYASARGYVGSADFELANVDLSSDTRGYKFETGFPIPAGNTNWEITPGIEFEHIETEDYNIEFDTNRFFINFAYAF